MSTDMDGVVSRSKVLISQGRIDECLELLRKVSEESPDYSDIHNQLGVVYCMLGSYGMAVGAFKRALELNPDYIEAHLNLSIAYSEMGRYTDALSEYNSAVRLENVEGHLTTGMRSKIANAHKALGVLYLEVEEPARAVAEFKKALEIAPHYLDIRTLLGDAYIRQGEYGRAIKELGKVVDMNPHFVDARVKLAVAYIRKGNRKTALVLLKEALAQEPDNEKVKALLNLNGEGT